MANGPKNRDGKRARQNEETTDEQDLYMSQYCDKNGLTVRRRGTKDLRDQHTKKNRVTCLRYPLFASPINMAFPNRLMSMQEKYFCVMFD